MPRRARRNFADIQGFHEAVKGMPQCGSSVMPISDGKEVRKDTAAHENPA
jgi:hypothetical protein